MAELYPQQDVEENNRPPAVPSKRQANRALAKLNTASSYWMKLLPNLMPYERDKFRALTKLQFNSFMHAHLQPKPRSLKPRTTMSICSKSKLQKEMFTQGEIAVERLFRSGSVEPCIISSRDKPSAMPLTK
ncbi:hypothetical protein O9992_23465 [Vibrio lentus]|nr:hypothetical protein [Vibrio lentus]